MAQVWLDALPKAIVLDPYLVQLTPEWLFLSTGFSPLLAACSNICSMFTDLVRICSVRILMFFWWLVCMVPLNRTGVLEILLSFPNLVI